MQTALALSGNVVPANYLLQQLVQYAPPQSQLYLDTMRTLEYISSVSLRTRHVLKIVYQVFPPSSNKIYWGMAKRSLTKAAIKYGEDFSAYCVRHHMAEQMYFDPDKMYALHLRFFFDAIENKTWNDPTLKKKDRAKERYKRFDLDNRIKLLTDCVRDFIGVDDSHLLAASQEKHQDPANPRIEIYAHEVDPTMFGIVNP